METEERLVQKTMDAGSNYLLHEKYLQREILLKKVIEPAFVGGTSRPGYPSFEDVVHSQPSPNLEAPESGCQE
jgi:hypothetical protein